MSAGLGLCLCLGTVANDAVHDGDQGVQAVIGVLLGLDQFVDLVGKQDLAGEEMLMFLGEFEVIVNQEF